MYLCYDTWALKESLYHYCGAYVYAAMVLGRFGEWVDRTAKRLICHAVLFYLTAIVSAMPAFRGVVDISGIPAGSDASTGMHFTGDLLLASSIQQVSARRIHSVMMILNCTPQESTCS